MKYLLSEPALPCRLPVLSEPSQRLGVRRRPGALLLVRGRRRPAANGATAAPCFSLTTTTTWTASSTAGQGTAHPSIEMRACHFTIQHTKPWTCRDNAYVHAHSFRLVHCHKQKQLNVLTLTAAVLPSFEPPAGGGRFEEGPLQAFGVVLLAPMDPCQELNEAHRSEFRTSEARSMQEIKSRTQFHKYIPSVVQARRRALAEMGRC